MVSVEDAVDGHVALQLLDLLFDGLVVPPHLVQLSEALLRGRRVVQLHRQRLVHELLTRGDLLTVQVNAIAFPFENVVNNLPLQIPPELILPHDFLSLFVTLVVLVRELPLSRPHHILLKKGPCPVTARR